MNLHLLAVASNSVVLSVLEGLLSNLPDTLAGSVALALGGIIVKHLTSSVRALRFLKYATELAYRLVEEEAAVTKDQKLDKAAIFLRKLSEVFAAHGRPEPTDELKARAVLLAKAKHGEEKMALADELHRATIEAAAGAAARAGAIGHLVETTGARMVTPKTEQDPSLAGVG